MRRMLRDLRHGLEEAWDGLWRNPALSFLAAFSIGISIYILGVFLLLAFNLDRFVDSLGRDLQVQIYLKEGPPGGGAEALRKELASDPAVAAARFVSGEEAKRRFMETFPSLKDLAERIGGSPFPASFDLTLNEGYRSPQAIKRLAASYEKAPGVEEVRYDLGWVERLASIVVLVRRGGYGLGLLLGLTAVATVGAVVRLTVLARREEIDIMKLVGATAGFIRGPFLLAAAAQGLVGGCLAIGALRLTHRLIERSEIFAANPFLSLVVGQFLPRQALLGLAGAGFLLGLLAAALSLRRAGTF